MILNKYSPEEYASFWGCDPIYDRPPRNPGDGYMFYNFGLEKHTIEWLQEFSNAINRTINSVRNNPESYCPEDCEGLQQLQTYVRNLIFDKHEASPTNEKRTKDLF